MFSAYTRPRYQVSFYRTFDPLVYRFYANPRFPLFSLMFNIGAKRGGRKGAVVSDAD